MRTAVIAVAVNGPVIDFVNDLVNGTVPCDGAIPYKKDHPAVPAAASRALACT